jgi:transcriptional regulator with XRE-family HTH domain
MAHLSELKPKQQRAIQLLASGLSGKEVASELGVTPKTISIWHRDVGFSLALAAEQSRQLRELKRRLVGASDLAMAAIVDIIRNCENSSVRLRAATAIIDRTLPLSSSDTSSESWALDPEEINQLSNEMSTLTLPCEEYK